ncbi:MAG: hypothetical protein QOE87_779 [Gaiellales bacterium]|jgi:anti-anti-sigma factor|nr:hypothetical protein [Gaiellales bacterium]
MTGHADDSTPRSEQLHVGQVAVGHVARGVAVVTMRGEHDVSTQPVLARALGLAAEHSNVVVDLSECSFIDSTVITESIKTSEALRASGERIILVMPPEQAHLARIAKMVRLAEFVELQESKDAALASLKHAECRESPPS